jgi:hypothetical protein
MMPLTADFNRREEQWLGVENPYRMKANAVIYKNGLVAVDSTGYAVPAADTAGLKVVGVSVIGVDNTGGADGAKTVDVHVGDLFKFATTGATQAWKDQIVYVVNDDAVALTDPGNSVKAGIVKRYESSTVVWVWVLDDNLLADISATTIDGIPLHDLRQADLAAMGISGTAGDHYLDLSADAITLLSNVANNSTATDVSEYQYRIPYNYLAGGTLSIKVNHTLFDVGTSGASTIDFSAYRQADGAVGSDIVSTAAQSMSKGAWTESTFVVTPTTLNPGDILNIKMTTAVIETAIANLQGKIDRLEVVYQRG